MDRPDVDPVELSTSLRAIRKINRLLGYRRSTRAALSRLLRNRPAGGAVSVLDVATGSGDVPADLLATLGSTRSIRVTGLDYHARTIAEARQLVTGVDFVRGDAMKLPYADGSFDFVLCSLFLHHLSAAQAQAAMGEMWRVARLGVIAGDLSRNRRALFWIRLMTAFASPIVRHDAVCSVRQAFTPGEILAIARRAGWSNPSLRMNFGHRFTVVAVK